MPEQPTAFEILDVLASTLRDLREDSELGSHRYTLLLAAHATDIVKREIELRPSQIDADWDVLVNILEEPLQGQPGEAVNHKEQAVESMTAELAARIRDGDFDDQLNQLATALMPIVKRKLDINRPGYGSG